MFLSSDYSFITVVPRDQHKSVIIVEIMYFDIFITHNSCLLCPQSTLAGSSVKDFFLSVKKQESSNPSGQSNFTSLEQ